MWVEQSSYTGIFIFTGHKEWQEFLVNLLFEVCFSVVLISNANELKAMVYDFENALYIDCDIESYDSDHTPSHNISFLSSWYPLSETYHVNRNNQNTELIEQLDSVLEHSTQGFLLANKYEHEEVHEHDNHNLSP